MKTCLLVLFFLCGSYAHAQEVSRNWFGTLKHGSNKITYAEFKEMIRNDSAALHHFKIYKACEAPGFITAIVGGGMIGYGLGGLLFDKRSDHSAHYILIGAGSGLAAVMIVLDAVSSNAINKSIALYNQKHLKTLHVEPCFRDNEIGLALKF